MVSICLRTAQGGDATVSVASHGPGAYHWGSSPDPFRGRGRLETAPAGLFQSADRGNAPGSRQRQRPHSGVTGWKSSSRKTRAWKGLFAGSSARCSARGSTPSSGSAGSTRSRARSGSAVARRRFAASADGSVARADSVTGSVKLARNLANFAVRPGFRSSGPPARRASSRRNPRPSCARSAPSPPGVSGAAGRRSVPPGIRRT